MTPASLVLGQVLCEENAGLESDWVDTSFWAGGVWERPRTAGPPGSMYRGLVTAPRHLVPGTAALLSSMSQPLLSHRSAARLSFMIPLRPPSPPSLPPSLSLCKLSIRRV
jgi:hypothetical protein